MNFATHKTSHVASSFLLATIFLALGLIQLRAEPLALNCDIDGKAMPLAAVVNDLLLVGTADKNIPATENAKWSISGSVVDNAEYVRWAPRYSLQAIPPSEFNKSEQAFQAGVSVDTNHAQYVEKFKLVDWPAIPLAGSAIVAAWLVDGRPTQIEIRPLSFVAISLVGDKFSFSLTQAEARGQPVLLLWSNGSLVRPVPEYSHKATQKALVAVLNNNVPELKTAVAGGAKLTKKSRTGATLAHYAAMSNAADVLAFLRQQSSDLVRAKTDFGDDTPLHWAALTGRVSAVKVLLETKSPKKLLAEGNIVKEGQIYNGVTVDTLIAGPLQSAVMLGHTDVVKLLLDAGAPVNVEAGEAPISVAISHGYPEIAEVLLHTGAKHDFRSQFAQSSLSAQAGLGREPMIRFLLEHHVNPDSVTSDARIFKTGETALTEAVRANALKTAATLLDHGANQDLQGPEGKTALHFAAVDNLTGITELLLNHHANISLRDNAGLRPLDDALLNEAKETALALHRAGAHIDIHSPEIKALLESALRQDLPEIISSAIADGWNPNEKIRAFCSAPALAKYYGATSCESMLRAAATAELAGHALPIAEINELDAKLNPIKMEMPRNPRIPIESVTVYVEFLVNGEGKAMFAHVINAPSRQLTVMTLNTVKDWIFTKPTVRGKPVWVKIDAPVVFKDGRNGSVLKL